MGAIARALRSADGGDPANPAETGPVPARAAAEIKHARTMTDRKTGTRLIRFEFPPAGLISGQGFDIGHYAKNLNRKLPRRILSASVDRSLDQHGDFTVFVVLNRY
ncbi:MAG TPA: hypothetical protein VFV81_05740, partial [Verrucomicrobiae bacterium]|nr:hypothetical protein [Verrucomicrobiae bacterium]